MNVVVDLGDHLFNKIKDREFQSYIVTFEAQNSSDLQLQLSRKNKGLVLCQIR